jgi:hypothetical protein
MLPSRALTSAVRDYWCEYWNCAKADLSGRRRLSGWCAGHRQSGSLRPFVGYWPLVASSGKHVCRRHSATSNQHSEGAKFARDDTMVAIVGWLAGHTDTCWTRPWLLFMATRRQVVGVRIFSKPSHALDCQNCTRPAARRRPRQGMIEGRSCSRAKGKENTELERRRMLTLIKGQGTAAPSSLPCRSRRGSAQVLPGSKRRVTRYNWTLGAIAECATKGGCSVAFFEGCIGPAFQRLKEDDVSAPSKCACGLFAYLPTSSVLCTVDWLNHTVVRLRRTLATPAWVGASVKPGRVGLSNG